MKNWLFNKRLKIVIITLIISTILLPSLNGDSLRILDLKQNLLLNNINNDFATTFYVGGSGAGNFSTIQAAIDAALDGFTIFIYDDSSPYYENIIIQNYPSTS